MFEIGWTELLVIGVVALIVIGPKDLPEMFRQLGRFTAKMRSMARDFQRAMDQAANETGVKDLAKDLKNVTSARSLGLDTVKDVASKFEKWDPIKNAARPTPSPMAVTAAAQVATPAAANTAANSAATTAANTVHGPATQALADAQAARKATLQEATEKLRAVSAPPAPSVADKPARKPRTKAARPAEAASIPASLPATKPRAGRKSAAKTSAAKTGEA